MSVPYLSFSHMNAHVKDSLMQVMEQVLSSHHYILGQQVSSFEREYAAYSGTQACAGVSNGLDALQLALKVLGIGPGDEVIVPSNTYIATVLAVTHMGAIPIFVEPNAQTYNIDPLRIEAALTPRTKAIMPVHLYGQACEMEAIMDIARNKGLWVVEDNAQSQGAAFKNERTGKWGHVNATSFFPTKNLGALGDAGALTSDNPEWISKAKMLRNYGSVEKYHNESVGFNMRLDELQAAILRVKLPLLDEWNRHRQTIAGIYNEALKGVGDVILPFTTTGATHVYHIYLIRTERRNALQEHLSARGIGTLIHYPVPPHLQPAYANLQYRRGDFPIAETLADTCLSLPVYPGMPLEDAHRVADEIKRFY
jgi:dTDP-4-amino-4,6-dideoxygalactose transaminase